MYAGPDDTLYWISGTAPSMSSFFMEKQTLIASYGTEPTLGDWIASSQTAITEYSLALSSPATELVDFILISISDNAVLNNTAGGTVNFFGNSYTRSGVSNDAVESLITLGWSLNNV